MLCDRRGLILSTISAEFLFPFTLKSVQFMNVLFQLIVAALSDVKEKCKLKCFICRSRILDRVFFFNIISKDFTWGIFTAWWFVTIRTNIRIWVYFFIRNSRTAWKVSKYGVMSGPYFPVIGLNTEIYEVNLRISSEYRKIRTGSNSVFRHFSRNSWFRYFRVFFSIDNKIWVIRRLTLLVF